MNLDVIFGLEAESILVSTSPLLLLGCVVAAVLAGWFCVVKYKDTYDIEKSLRLYVPFALMGAIGFTIAGLPVLFSIGAQLCGLVALAMISSRYFTK